jgi:hypothetical protein
MVVPPGIDVAGNGLADRLKRPARRPGHRHRRRGDAAGSERGDEGEMGVLRAVGDVAGEIERALVEDRPHRRRAGEGVAPFGSTTCMNATPGVAESAPYSPMTAQNLSFDLRVIPVP